MTDCETLLSYYVLNDSVITCEAKVLLVAEPSGGILTFQLDAGDTVNDIKQRIEKETKIPIVDQRIFYSCCSFRGKTLEDSKTIAENKIGDNFVNVLQASKDLSQIYVELLGKYRRIVNIQVNFEDSVLKLKKNIQTKIGDDDFQLSYKLFLNDNELENGKSLAYYGIKNEMVLQVCEDKLIYVKTCTGEKFKLFVKRSDDILSLKKKIKKKLKYQRNYKLFIFMKQS